MGENFHVEHSIWKKQKEEMDQAHAGPPLIYKEFSLF